MFVLTWLPEMNNWIKVHLKYSVSLIVSTCVHYHKIVPLKKTAARILRKTPNNLVISTIQMQTQYYNFLLSKLLKNLQIYQKK